ncbi:unnamed protein product [Colias eurytheme]|nr:unnamed protein product [Colias eurytheme]
MVLSVTKGARTKRMKALRGVRGGEGRCGVRNSQTRARYCGERTLLPFQTNRASTKNKSNVKIYVKNARRLTVCTALIRRLLRSDTSRHIRTSQSSKAAPLDFRR